MDWVRTIDEDFVRQNFKDSVAEAIITQHRKRSTVIKIVVTSFLILSGIAIGYAVANRNERLETQIRVLETREQIAVCMKEAERQMLLAEEARQQADEQHQQIQKQLAACQSKSRK